MSLEINLKGRHALVCGSTQGIGHACALALANAGAAITLAARNPDRLEEVRSQLPVSDSQAHQVMAVDFSAPEQLADRLKRQLADRPPIDILINNSGGPPAGPITDASPEAFINAFRQHLISSQILVQHVLPAMKDRRHGRIINIISTSVKEPIPGLGVSNTIRAAVGNWAKTLAGEVGPFGITVNNILPGFTRTGRLESIIQGKAAAQGVPVQKVIDDMKSMIPLARFAEPSEIAAVAAFLASDLGGYVHGVSLPVDGGRTSSH